MPAPGKAWTDEMRAKRAANLEAKKQAAQDAAAARVPLRAIPGAPKGSRWTMKAGNRWEDGNDNADTGPDRLHINKEDIPEGMDLMWVTSAIFGQEVPQHRAQFERKGWTPVHGEDFDGCYDGKFTPKGAKGEIGVDGLVLMARPIELTKKAKQREYAAAREQVRIKEQALRGGDMPVSGADHPSAIGSNRINRSYERLAIPEE